jgi:hypothetical protein
MKALRTWIDREARRDLRRPRLEHALLTARPWRYAAYRLRFLAIRAALQTALFSAEVYLLSMVFALDFLAPVLVYRSAIAIATGLWWGGLEELRARVRVLARQGRWNLIRQQIDTWLGLAVLIGALEVGGVVLWIAFGPSPFESFSVFDAYGLACAIRLALDLWTSTYHSGIYALRRIYRPLWTILIGDVLEFAGFILLWEPLGPWGLAITIVAVGVLRAGIALGYTRRAYRYSRIPTLRWLRLGRAFVLLRWPDIIAFGKHALANGTAQLDAVLVLVLLGAESGNVSFAALFHLLRPFLSAGHGWVRLFYFDYKKLQSSYPRIFRERFERFLWRLAWWVTGGLGVLLLAATFIIWRARFYWPALLLLPFLAARSIYSLYQVQAFSYNRYDYLLKLALGIGIGLFVLVLLPGNRVILLTGISLLLLLATWLGGAPISADDADQYPGARVTGLLRWLAQLSRVPTAVRICTARVDARLARPARIMREIAAILPGGSVTRWGRRHLIWFELTQSGEKADRATVIACAGGCLSELHVGEIAPNGVAAIRAAIKDELFERDLCEQLTAPPPLAPAEELRREFQKRFFRGWVLDMNTGGIPVGNTPLFHPQLRQILKEIRQLSSGISPRERNAAALAVSVYAPQGEPQLIFVTAEEQADLATWRRIVRSASVRDSVAWGG